MGKYNKGILGAFSGKVGNVVGSSWRGMDILRSLPKSGNKNPTESQLLQRDKFAFVAHFLLPFRPLLAEYFGTPSGNRSRNNLATSYHLKEAVATGADGLSLVYGKVLLCRGELQGVPQISVVAAEGRTLRFTWTNNSGQATAKATDRLIVAVHDEENGFSDFFLEVAKREQATATVVLPDFYADSKVHCWTAFAAENGKLNSTTVYMGLVEIA